MSSSNIPSKILHTERSENQENSKFSKFRHWIYFFAFVMLGLLVAILVLLVILLVMKQIDTVVESASLSPTTDAVVVPNTTSVPDAPSTTSVPDAPSTTSVPDAPSTTAEPITLNSTTAVTLKVISDVTRVGHPQSVSILITEKVTERPIPKRTSDCIWTHAEGNYCSTDSYCNWYHGHRFPHCVRSAGPRSRKICCAFV